MSASRRGAALLLVLVGWAALIARLHYRLPSPVAHDVDPQTLRPTFNEARALDIIRHLSVDIGYRIVGPSARARRARALTVDQGRRR